ncbi:hypothetical protein AVDCRST_MAG94-1563 [uncultured Leptolyngbya sp.]|uniref:Uncharacterized protein n=1 Tax=uncultured Leptolyngbya sp. TaxID=332963 RepID=A0A6J4L683_9CYAN|nr:hypothetical protein AVDCRST_MAG94-1563 [uncultured Leptolyngbya sp.]
MVTGVGSDGKQAVVAFSGACLSLLCVKATDLVHYPCTTVVDRMRGIRVNMKVTNAGGV